MSTTEFSAPIERMLLAKEVAEVLGVHENYVYALASSGELPSYKIKGCRRFRESQIWDWAETKRS
jgi:excisionase family DNA binding protein